MVWLRGVNAYTFRDRLRKKKSEEKPDYTTRAVFESLANALKHRNYDASGSEVHVDMFDDRLEIYFPGVMPDGTLIHERETDAVPSTRSNPIIANIFHRLDYIERRGSGLKKIQLETSYLHGYTKEYAPEFRSTPTAFHVILKNMNYDLHGTAGQDNRLTFLIAFCSLPRSKKEMQEYVGIASREHFEKTFLKPLNDAGQLRMTIPDKPSSRNQK